jgi:hypothetical protein
MSWRRKSERNSEYNWNESGTSNHFDSTEKELNAEKIFKEEYNLEMNFQELQQTKTTN